MCATNLPSKMLMSYVLVKEPDSGVAFAVGCDKS